MSSRIGNVSFDAHNPYAQARWWDEVLDGFSQHAEDQPGDEECGLEGADGQWVLFLAVPEDKVVKNRVHLCLVPADRTREEEVERLLGAGAALSADRRHHDGSGWVVLQDPEGNEFCVLRGPDRATS